MHGEDKYMMMATFGSTGIQNSSRGMAIKNSDAHKIKAAA